MQRVVKLPDPSAGGVKIARSYGGLVYLALFLFCVALNAFSPETSAPSLHFSRIRQTSLAASTSLQNALHVGQAGLGTEITKKLPPPSVGQCISRGLMLNRVDHPSVLRVREQFECGCTVPQVYEPHENPTVCAIVQSFNHADNVPRIAKMLKENTYIQEIIVCEDGSTDGKSLELWAEHLQGMNHFVIASNNLHESRCYNRAMRMSSAEFFILMQDDDIAPAPTSPSDGQNVNSAGSENWVSEAVGLFKDDPRLGVLSGFIGQLWNPETGGGYEFGEQQSDHGGMRKGATRRIPFLSPRTRRPFMYVECGWIAPLFIRSSVLHRVPGIDLDVFHRGEPGVWQDCVLSYASWAAGWRVGVFDAGFERGIGGHGSTSTPEKAALRGKMWKRAKEVTDGRFERAFVHSVVLDANNHSLVLRYPLSETQG